MDFIVNSLSGVRNHDTEPLMRLVEDSQSLDKLLDNPRLLNAILTLASPVTISPELYFYVLVRHSLLEAGIDHLDMTDYVAATLAEYSRGVPFQARGSSNLSDATYHIDYLSAIRDASAYDQFYINVRCGNQFLMLTGLFPRFLERRLERRGAPGVRYYESVARESFRQAGNHPLADEFALSEVYQLLAERMPQTRFALNRMAREFLFLGA